MQEFVVKPSGDAEPSDLWQMPIGEVEKIKSDPDHPRHDEANAVIGKALAPIGEALALKISPITADLSKRIGEIVASQVRIPKVDLSKFVPNVDLSWAGPKLEMAPGRPVRPIVIRSSNSELDFTSEVQPRATVSEVRAGAEKTVAEWGRLVDLQQERIAQAQTHADQQVADSKSTRTLGVWALVGSWVAAIASVAAIFVMIYHSG